MNGTPPAPRPAPPRDGGPDHHFTAIAGRYDRLNTLLSLGLHHRWKRRAVAALGLAPGERLLDLCGGTADLSLLAAPRLGSAGRAVCCDLNAAMLARGAAKVRRAGHAGRVAAVRGDAQALGFAGGAFDAAIIGFGLRNLTDRPRGLAEMHRVLRPGGRLVCLEFSLPPAPWFRRLYDLYAFALIPAAGRLLAGSAAAYRYLNDSIRGFPPPAALSGLMAEAGFGEVTFRRLTGGIAVIHRALRP